MKNDIVGRKRAIHLLTNALNEKDASLVIVTGRRRVGKTFLVNNVFDNDFVFKITGDYQKNKEEQLLNFTDELKRKWKKNFKKPADWREAFNFLREYIDSLSIDSKKVIFFDEFPWLDNHSSGFLGAFEYFWNDYASSKKNLLFIICGSASSWIEDKIINNKGGLYNRHARKIHLSSFTLKETEDYLLSRNIDWSRYDIAITYMILGGIPYYLRLLDNELSLGQNIDNLFFAKDADLKDEFQTLFRTLFTSSVQNMEIVKTLSKARYGLTREEIASSLNIPLNGDLSKKLDNLSITGFVTPIDVRNGKKRTVYRLSDYFSSFYLRFIEGNNGVDNHYWSKSSDNPSVNAWKGLVFESLCFDHIEQIKKALGINGVISENFSWSHKADEVSAGAQIDLVLKRRDKVTNLCEIKFVNGVYEIDKDYNLSLENKKLTYRNVTSSKDTIQMTFISTYGIKVNKYSSVVTNSITLDDLFE